MGGVVEGGSVQRSVPRMTPRRWSLRRWAVYPAGRVSSSDDLTLLDRWRMGDSEAGQELFQRHFDSIYGFFETKCSRPKPTS